jgi:hypothetical protein
MADSPDLLFRDLTDWSVVGPNGFPDYRYNDREIIRAFANNSVATLGPGAVVTEIARRAKIGPGQIYRWRRELGVGNGFAQVLIAPAGDDAGCPAASAIQIAFAGKARMRSPALIPVGLAAAVVKALSGR